jgi:integrase
MTKTKARREFGNVRQLPSKRWQAFYRLDGVRHTAERTFRTETEAKDYLTTVKADVLQGRWMDPAAAKVLFKDYAEKWITRRSEDPRSPLAATTKAKYRRLLDTYVLDEFGGYQLGNIKSGQVTAWYDGIARGHPSTAAGAYRLLATIFNSAVHDDEIIARSPCKVEGGSREQAAERPTLTEAELEKALLVTDEKYLLALLLAAWGQLRRSEIIGLQRRDIDLKKGTVKIEQVWVVPDGERPTEKAHPKTDAGKRTLHMPPNVIDAMSVHLERYTRPEPDAWLFERNGRPLHPRTLDRVWVRARKVAGRPDVRLHDLRHTGLTWTAQIPGVTLAEIMRRAGHSSPAAALRYQHAADERDQGIAVALGQRATNGASSAS